MLLNHVLCCHAGSQHRIDQVLEDLPKEKEVVALRDQEVHVEEFMRQAFLVIESLGTCLELKRDCLIDVEHLEHKLFDLLDPDDLESLVEELDQVARRAREVGAVPVDLCFNSRVRLLSQDVDHHLDQSAVNLYRVRVAQGNEAVIKGIITTSILLQ